MKKKQVEKKREIVLVRTYSAGVHYGELASMKGREVVLLNTRRIWCWYGATTLSQLATTGTNEKSKCKFSCAVSKNILTEAIEIITMTPVAIQSLNEVDVWQI